MVEICDTILYSRCGNPPTDVILTAPVLWAPRHYNTLVTNALNPPKTRNFTNFPKYISADSHNFRFRSLYASYFQNLSYCRRSTGESLSEALIFASINPQYDNRIKMKLQAQNMFCPYSVIVVFMVIPWTRFCHVVR